MLPVTVNLHDEFARTLCLRIQTETGQPLTQATVRLTDLAGQIVASGGVTETIQQVYSQSSDQTGPGYSCFANLAPGPYHAQVGRGEVLLGQTELTVVPGDDIQEELIVVDEPSVIYSFSVTPTDIEDVYTTVITLTFIPHEVPRLVITPDRINLCGSETGIVNQTVTVHNFFPVTLTQAVMHMETYGNVSAIITGPDGTSVSGHNALPIGVIPPNSHLPFDLQLTVNMQACHAGQKGTIGIRVEAVHERFLPESWYRLDATPALLPLGQTARIPMRLVNVGFPEESNLNSIAPGMENVTLTPPQNLTWMAVSTTTIPYLGVNEEIAFDLIVEPPQWLPEGFYYDHIRVSATNGITALIGIEAEMTSAGLRVETQFVTPLTIGEGGGAPDPAPSPDPPPHSQPQPPWDAIVTNWNPDIFGPQDVILGVRQIEVGCYCAQPVGGWAVLGNRLVHTHTAGPAPGFAYAPDFKENVVILQLEQRFSLDREAFTADLSLGNGLAESLTDLEVAILFTSGTGEAVMTRLPGTPITATGEFTPVLPANSVIPADMLLAGVPSRWQKLYPVNFVVIPETPTQMPDLPAGANYFASWTLVPDAPGLTEMAYFEVRAIIRYKVNGVQKEIVTSPAQISVSPQPRIVLDYYIPNYVLGGQTFDWLVVATNIGYGTVRNFRVETPQPKIIKQSERYPTDFTLIGPSALSWGDVGPGQQVSGVWRILPSNPGSFVDWAAECKHQNYKGVELPPLVYCVPRVHFLDTSYLAESQQWGKGDSCLAGLFQAFDSDPVNTFSGNFTYSHLDVSIPTWGLPLEFVRSYNSRDTRAGPFGPAWTHNFDMDLKYESFIGMNKDGVIGQQTYFAARLPHGSIVYFNVSPDGETITPFPGVRATLTRDLTTYRLMQECDRTVYTYNAQQKLISIEDANGNQLTLTYDNNGNLSAVTEPAGRQLTFDYDAAGRLTRLTDPLGRSVVYTYTLGYLSAMADFRGQISTFYYTLPAGPQQPGYLVSRTDANGHLEFYNHYSADGRVLWQEDGLGHRTTFAYDYDPNSGQQQTTMTGPLGYVTIDTYDADGRLIRRQDHDGFYETYAYNADNNPIRLVDKKGQTTLYSWDECACDIDRTVDPMGNTTVMTFNSQKQVASIQDKRGYVTSFSYDERTNLLSATDPLGGTRSYTYGAQGELLSETDENGHTALYGYDEYGHTVVITNALGYVIYMEYDLAGRLIRSTDALSRTTLYLYDAGDNLLQVSAPLSQTTLYTYDNVGNLIAAQDALGRVTTYAYNARGELLAVTDPLGGTRSFVYDANGNVIVAVDENNQATTYQYDSLNRLVQATNPLSGTTRYTYDPVGNRLTEEDANGNVTAYLYDANNRIVTTIYADGSQMTALYDQADNLLQLTDGEGRSVTYVYDALGRVTSQSNPLGGTTTYGYDAAGNRILVVDAEGRETHYGYNALNRLAQITDPLGGVTTIHYDAVGNQLRLVNANGVQTGYVYDDLNRLVLAIENLVLGEGEEWDGFIPAPCDPHASSSDENLCTQYEYDTAGNLLAVADPLGRTTTFAYDPLNRPLTVTNPAGQAIQYQYDAVGNLSQWKDEEGRATRTAYDALNRPILITDTLGGVTALAYDANGNLLAETDPEGRVTTYGYDTFNQLIAVINALGETTQYEYDRVGNLLRLTAANNAVFEYTHDGLDRLVTARDPLSNTTHYLYDGVGNLVSLVDAEENAAAYSYDTLDRLTTTIDALGGVTTYQYDHLGNLTAVIDAAGRQTTFTYDALNRLVEVSDALGQTTHYAYDAAGNQVSLTDPLGRTTTFVYDELDRLAAVTNAISGTTVYSYSAAGNLIAAQDALGRVTAYGYDALDRLTLVIENLVLGAGEEWDGVAPASCPPASLPDENVCTQYEYDAVGNLLAVTDPLGRTVTMGYDALDRPLQIIDPLGDVTSFTYDVAGNRASITNANQQTVQYSYDLLNRLATVTDPLAQVSRFTYDRVGNQVGFTDPLSRTIVYNYDALYRLTAVIDPLGNATNFSYDAVGNQTGLTDAEGRTTTAAYDALNRPILATDPLGGETQFVYDDAGNPIGQIDPAGVQTRYIYDDLDRLLAVIENWDGLTPSPCYPLASSPEENVCTQYEYDALGNLLAVADPLGRLTRYQYDRLNRPLLATDPLSGTIQFQYDAVGNLISQVDPLNKQVLYTVDALNRVVQAQDPLGGLTSYQYDPLGNLVGLTDARGFTSQMAYDELNRLRQATNPLGQTVEYVYDAVGNNVAVIDPLGRTTQFLYDELDRLIAATDPLSRTTSYSYDRVGNPMRMVDAAGVVTQYVYDPLNRLAMVTENFVEGGPVNAATNVVTAFSYDSVGNLTALTNPLGHTFTFAYDQLRRLASSQDPLGRGTTYSYDVAGNLAQAIDANGAVTAYAYDAVNRPATITRPDETVAFTYDTVGNRLSMSDNSGVTFYSYDDLHRLVSVTDPLAQLVEYSYDAVSARAGLTYPGGDQANYVYDAAGRLVQVVDWDGGQTHYVYDAAGQLVQIGLPNGVTGTLTYDDAGQLTLLQYVGVTGTLASYAYSYDLTGNLSQAVEYLAGVSDQLPPDVYQEADGLVVMEAANYYAQVERSQQAWQPRQGLAGYEGESYLQLLPGLGALYASDYITRSPELQYRIYFNNPGDYTVWIYGAAVGAAGDSLHVGLNGAAGQAEAITGFRFNEWSWSAQTMAAGAPATATISIPEAGLYTLNVWGREDGLRLNRILLALDPAYVPEGNGPTESQRGGTAATTAAANLAGPELTPPWRVALGLILANPLGLLLATLGIVSPLAYQRRHRWAAQAATAVAIILTIVGFGAAAVYAAPPGAMAGGPLRSLPPDFGGATTIYYSYDPLHRLTGAAYSSGYSLGYSYDAAGNRLGLSLNGAPAVAYSYDAANRLLQLHDLVGDELIQYSYDDNGNLLDDGSYGYSYDAANRLILVDDGVSSASYFYNGDGARIAQIEDGLRTDYVQDVALPLPQVLTARQGGTVSQYLQGLSLIGEQRGGTGEFAAPPAWQYHLPDALGSVRQVADAAGQVALARHYDPFGGLLASAGGATSAYGFAGEEQDAQRGHLYLRARTYAPATGRFLQQDSYLGRPDQPRTLHRYAYAFNNPLRYVDPTGHTGQSVNGGGPRPQSAGAGGPSFIDGTPGGALAVSPFFSSPSRSVNGGNWSPFSDPVARQKSEGWRPALCGIGDLIARYSGDPFEAIDRLKNRSKDRLIEQVNQLIDKLGLHNEIEHFAQKATGAYDQVAAALKEIDDRGAAYYGRDKWELIKHTAGLAVTAIAAFAAVGPAGLAFMGAGALAAGGISIGEQYFVEGKSLRETLNIHTLNFAIKGAIAAGVLATTGNIGNIIGKIRNIVGVGSADIVGAGSATFFGNQTLLAAFSGGFFNVGVHHIFADYNYSGYHFLTDFVIGAAAGVLLAKIHAGARTLHGVRSGLVNVSEGTATRASRRYLNDDDQPIFSLAHAGADFLFGFGGYRVGKEAGNWVESSLTHHATKPGSAYDKILQSHLRKMPVFQQAREAIESALKTNAQSMRKWGRNFQLAQRIHSGDMSLNSASHRFVGNPAVSNALPAFEQRSLIGGQTALRQHLQLWQSATRVDKLIAETQYEIANIPPPAYVRAGSRTVAIIFGDSEPYPFIYQSIDPEGKRLPYRLNDGYGRLQGLLGLKP
jgi:RHS repeat-associated protein